MTTDLDAIRQHLERCRAQLIAASDALHADRWQSSPAPGRWSGA